MFGSLMIHRIELKAICKVALLLQFSSLGKLTFISNSLSNSFNHTCFATVVLMFLYLASAKLVATVLYFFDLHEINESPNVMQNLVTDFLDGRDEA